MGQATDIRPGGALGFSIFPIGDVDWFKVVVDQPGELALEIDEGPKNLDLTFHVLDADRHDLTGWVPPYAKGGLTEGRADLKAPGAYYIEVRDSNNDARSIQSATLSTWRPSSACSWRLRARRLLRHGGQASPSGSNPGYTRPIGDFDWEVVYAEQPGELTVTVDQVPQQLDVAFHVLDADQRDLSGWLVGRQGRRHGRQGEDRKARLVLDSSTPTPTMTAVRRRHCRISGNSLQAGARHHNRSSGTATRRRPADAIAPDVSRSIIRAIFRRSATHGQTMLLGCIADDFTGASDLANTLAKGGMATVQFVGVPAASAAARLRGRRRRAEDALDPGAARPSRSPSRRWTGCTAQGCRQFLFKYCSTFNSTPRGQYRPGRRRRCSTALDAPRRRRLPGLSGDRTHALHGPPLRRRPAARRNRAWRSHPLTPMTDPDIRRWLRRQTRGEVGLVPLRRASARARRRSGRPSPPRRHAGRRPRRRRRRSADDDLIAHRRGHRRPQAGHRRLRASPSACPTIFGAPDCSPASATAVAGGQGPGVVLSGLMLDRPRAAGGRAISTVHPGLAARPGRR